MTENTTNVDLKAAEEELNKSAQEAEELLKDKAKAESTVNKAHAKAFTVRESLESVWHHLQLMFSLVKDYIAGNYKEVPTKTIILTIGGILYFLLPFDLIPDIIPIVGYLDDVAVLGMVIKQVSSDLEKYEEWKKEEE